MLNYLLKTSWTHWVKRPGFTILNVLGLSLGITAIFLIFLFVRHELSFDQHFPGADEIYRVGVSYTFDGKVDVFANTPRPVASTLQTDFPAIIAQTRMAGANGLFTHQALFKVNERFVESKEVFYADSTYFEVFEKTFLRGNAATALSSPNSLVVSEKLALRLFNNTDVLGRTVKMDNALELQITGVFENDPSPTHMPVEALIPWVHEERPGELNQWIGGHVYGYIRLNSAENLTSVTSQLGSFYTQHMKATFDRFQGSAELLVQPLTSIHLESDLQWEAYPNGDFNTVYMLLIVSLFILALIVINYANLATAITLQRLREIALRKVLGSSKGMIYLQLAVDSFLTTLISVIFSTVLILLLLPFFSQITGIDFDSSHLVQLSSGSLLVVLFVTISLSSSIHPAMVISRIQAGQAINNRYSGSRGSALVRKTLVGIQFAMAVALVFATGSVIRQSEYMLEKDLGFDKEHTLAIPLRDARLAQNIETVRNGFSSLPGVISAAGTKSYPGQPLVQAMFDLKEADGSYTNTGLEMMETSLELPETIGMEVISGRFFDESFGTDMDQSLMINEAGAKLFGGNEAAIGRQIAVGTDSLGNPIDYDIVGVVRDFHTISLHAAIQPVIIFPTEEQNTLLLRTETDNPADLLTEIESYWQDLNSSFPLEYTFLDADFTSLHGQEANLQHLLSLFSVLIVFIACLGLLGLVAYTTRRKSQEITIRKVVGSTNTALVKLMLREQLMPIFIALVIAIPAVWYVMQEWLSNFAYHTHLQWSLAFVVSLLILGIAILTTAYHVLKAAVQNPAQNLRHH